MSVPKSLIENTAHACAEQSKRHLYHVPMLLLAGDDDLLRYDILRKRSGHAQN